MKFYLWSDVHLDFASLSLDLTTCDSDNTLIIAGDWGTAERNGIAEIRKLCKIFNNVVFVTGNHDYYGSTIEEVNSFWKGVDAETPNFHFLNNNVIEIDGTTILGATLWTDMNNYSPMEQLNAISSMSDFALIRGFSAGEWMQLHKESAEFLYETVGALGAEGKKPLIVTHHAPHELCVEEKFKGSHLNYLYHCTNMEPFFQQDVIKGWIHGHMHSQEDIMIRGIPVFRNARGYKGYENVAETWQPFRQFEVF